MILVVGVGNVLRNDDGIGALVVSMIEAENWPGVETRTTHQLHLESILDFMDFEKVIIVDASCTGVDYHFEKIILTPASPPALASSHHLSLQILMALAQKIYSRDLDLYLCAIKGHNFDIGETITPEVQACGQLALKLISSEIGVKHVRTSIYSTDR